MPDLVSNYGLGFQPPSYHKIRVKCLIEEVKATKDALKVNSTGWSKTRCAIMTMGGSTRGERLIELLSEQSIGNYFSKIYWCTFHLKNNR